MLTGQTHSREFAGGVYIVKEDAPYGLQGEGSTASDFAVSLAVGGKFSPAYGFLTFKVDNKEYTLMEIKDLDITKLKIKQGNPHFATATIEIGPNTSYLGNSASTRKKLKSEYILHDFNKLLEKIPTWLD